MLHGSPHPGVAGSELPRLLARLADTAPAEARRPFAERLGRWLGWTDAIALTTALNTVPATPSPASLPGAGGDRADFERVRAALRAAIAAGPQDEPASPTDFSPFRRHCHARQQAMQDAVAALRQRLRAALAAKTPELARLAALDAAMEPALAGHERRLLALVPLRLQSHFDRLRTAGGGDPAWLATFRDDMNHVLQAELAHRLLPASGLLDTLRLHETT